MPCYSPLKAMRSSGGIIILRSDSKLFNLQLPCGQCTGCRLERSRQWAVRCMHEASLYEHNCFVTLTYDDDHVPHDNGLNHSHFQLFMKRLRKRFPDQSIRYYMCGEYGAKNGRPHFHVCLFNISFNDLTLWRKSTTGNPLFRSSTLEALWPFGFSSVGNLTFESAAYVARYVMKKITGDAADTHYRNVSTDTGEVFDIRPEYNRMSLKPGIGAGWYDKFHTDVFPHDRVVVNGTETKPPKYYDRLLQRRNPDAYDEIKSQRMLDMVDAFRDNTPQRLSAKLKCADAKLSQLQRGLLK